MKNTVDVIGFHIAAKKTRRQICEEFNKNLLRLPFLPHVSLNQRKLMFIDSLTEIEL